MYNTKQLQYEGWTIAKWRYASQDKLDPVYLPPEIDGKKSMLMINENGDCILAAFDGSTIPVIQVANETGYYCIIAQANHNFKTGVGLYPTHRIMMYTFDGLPPEKDSTVDHINGRRTDNHISNLRWLSLRDNRSLRQFGSRASKDEKRLGRDVTYDARANRIIYNNIKNAAIEDDYNNYLNETQDFLNEYM